MSKVSLISEIYEIKLKRLTKKIVNERFSFSHIYDAKDNNKGEQIFLSFRTFLSVFYFIVKDNKIKRIKN